jgi:hypothetical protein
LKELSFIYNEVEEIIFVRILEDFIPKRKAVSAEDWVMSPRKLQLRPSCTTGLV